MNRLSLSFIFTLLFLSSVVFAEGAQKNSKYNFVHYKKQSFSLVPWSELNEKVWLDFREWKRELRVKETLANWEKAARDANLVETVGRVIDCVGTCHIYHGLSPTRAQFRSELREGDEVVTKEDSYAWLYMMDGTIVRLSSQSSIALKEIDVGDKEIFLQARMNYGNMLWLSRDKYLFKENDLTETDQIFLPLVYNKANYYRPVGKREDDLMEIIDEDTPALKQYKRLNTLIEENNKLSENGIKKVSHSFLVMPNGTVSGKNFKGEFYVAVGGESYFKKRSFKMYNPDVNEDESPAQFYYRGFDNSKFFDLESDIWYQVSADGREINPYDENQGEFNLYIGEYLSARIPTILLARENLWLEYSGFTYKKMSSAELGANYNYRLWGNFEDDKSDLSLRLQFLKEHTRRVETTQLRVSESYKKKREALGEASFQMNYDEKYYGKAMQVYLLKRNAKDIKAESEDLNSTKKRFWGLVNGRR